MTFGFPKSGKRRKIPTMCVRVCVCVTKTKAVINKRSHGPMPYTAGATVVIAVHTNNNNKSAKIMKFSDATLPLLQ